MSAFAVLLHEDETDSNARLRELIEEKYPGSGHFKFSDFAYLVTGPRLVDEAGEGSGI